LLPPALEREAPTTSVDRPARTAAASDAARQHDPAPESGRAPHDTSTVDQEGDEEQPAPGGDELLEQPAVQADSRRGVLRTPAAARHDAPHAPAARQWTEAPGPYNEPAQTRDTA